MHRSTSERHDARPGREGWLAECCRLVGSAVGEDLAAVPVDGSRSGLPSAPLTPGWLLEGAVAGASLHAAAELIRRLDRDRSEIRSLSAEILARYEEATLVYRLGDRLSSVLGETAIARVVLEETTSVLGARSGEIWLETAGVVGLAAAVPEAPALPELPADVVRTAIEEGRPWLREAGDEGETAIAVPVPGRARPLGVLMLRGRRDGSSYRTGEEKLLTALASLVSSAVRNDRLVAEVRNADARRRQHEIARQVHRRLLPDADPELPGVELAAWFRSAEAIGGDYYGYVPLDDGSLAVAIADVSGHGVGAALYMASVKGVLQSEARRGSPPARLLERLNAALWSDFSRSDVFATACVMQIDPDGREMTFASAGHNPPLLVAPDGAIEALSGEDVALGLLPGPDYRQQQRVLAPGSVLVLYTDGLIEARDRRGSFFGEAGLREVLEGSRELPAASIRARIRAALQAHLDGAPPADDVTLVVARVGGAGETTAGGDDR